MSAHSSTARNKPQIICSNEPSTPILQKILPLCVGNFDQTSLGSDDSGISSSSGNTTRNLLFKSSSTEDFSIDHGYCARLNQSVSDQARAPDPCPSKEVSQESHIVSSDKESSAEEVIIEGAVQ